jgi:hypothetical protein
VKNGEGDLTVFVSDCPMDVDQAIRQIAVRLQGLEECMDLLSKGLPELAAQHTVMAKAVEMLTRLHPVRGYGD